MRTNDVESTRTSGEQHRLSIGLTIGATIFVIGLIMFLYGWLGNADYSKSLGFTINFWWGLLMIIFGGVMVLWNYWRTRKDPQHVH